MGKIAEIFAVSVLGFFIVLALSGFTGTFQSTGMTTETSPGTTGQLIEKTFIPSSTIQDMAYESLEKSVQEKKTALIFFYYSFCDVCTAQIAEIESLLDHFQNTDPKFLEDNFTYYEYDFNTGLRDKFNVTDHHTLILIKDEKEVMRTREALTKEELLERITS